MIMIKSKSVAIEILHKLNNNANFSDLAIQYSAGPGKEKGGDLGYFSPGDMMEPLNEYALKLKVGQYSDIIETSDGYYIIMKTDDKTKAIEEE